MVSSDERTLSSEFDDEATAKNGRAAVTIESLLHSGAIKGHKDGNYGSLYPRVEEFGTEGVPFLTAKSLNDGRIDIQGAPRLSERRANELPFGFVQSGDVLLSHNATVGRVAVVPEVTGRLLIGTSLTYFRVDTTRLLPRYLAAYFSGINFQYQLAALMSHSTRNQVPITAQRSLRVVVPPLSEQIAIANTLGILDEKIALLATKSGTLESVARAIFKSWFVDFDPVRAKADGREPEGMDAVTAALFPCEFVATGGQSVPLGWRCEPLDTGTNFLNGLALQKFAASPDEDSLPAIKIAQLKRGSVEGADPVSRRLPAQYLIRDGDLIFSWSGSLEVVVWCGGEGALNQHLFKVTSDAYPIWFVHGWLLEHLNHFREIAASKVTTMGHIQRHHLHEAIVTVPDSATLERLGEGMDPLFQRSIQCRLQARTVAELRDSLLPRMISGKLRVPEAEKLVEAVL